MRSGTSRALSCAAFLVGAFSLPLSAQAPPTIQATPSIAIQPAQVPEGRVSFRPEQSFLGVKDGQTPAAVNANSAQRPCDACPLRDISAAFLQGVGINVLYGLGNLARGEVTARVTPKT